MIWTIIENALGAQVGDLRRLVMVGFALILACRQTTLDQKTVTTVIDVEGSAVVAGPAGPEFKPANAGGRNPRGSGGSVVVASRAEMLQNWPGLRGAAAGIVNEGDMPTEWDGEKGTGIIWKKEIPLPGFNSPIVWNDRIFLSGGDQSKRQVYCYSVDKGDLLWTYDVTGIEGSPDKAPKVSADTGYAAATRY